MLEPVVDFRIYTSRLPLDDEYYNQADGLIYCSKCHTPRQIKEMSEDGTKTLYPFVNCKCQRDQSIAEAEAIWNSLYTEDGSEIKPGCYRKTKNGYVFSHW